MPCVLPCEFCLIHTELTRRMPSCGKFDIKSLVAVNLLRVVGTLGTSPVGPFVVVISAS